MNTSVLFQEIAEQTYLGKLTAAPQSVSGGFMHKMYRIETQSGIYALKLLNPVIMKRPEAINNFQRAEYLERILEENDIPVIPALEKNGSKMQCLKGQYYYLFDWFGGKALDWHQLKEEHCRIAGKLLAEIHSIPCREDQNVTVPNTEKKTADDSSNPPEQESEDWDDHAKQAKTVCPELAEALAENRELLYLARRKYDTAIKNIPKINCICDGDMDCKNVLWLEDRPYIIDLECLDYGNPYTEMFQLALDWAGGPVCELDFGRFRAFVSAYGGKYGSLPADWDTLSGAGYSWLDWLAYNVRRGLGIECCDEAERQLGIREARKTITRIQHYASVQKELVHFCENF